jgi:predicted amidohydrolase YtcJ
MNRLIITNAQVNGSRYCRVVIENEKITEIQKSLVIVSKKKSVNTDTRFVDAQGGNLVPGLWDHHNHLFATAARKRSLNASNINTFNEWHTLLLSGQSTVKNGAWLRVVGYDDSKLGALNKQNLDLTFPTETPIKVQHRSGHHWVINDAGSKKLERMGINIPSDGILWDMDAVLHNKSSEYETLLNLVSYEAQLLASAGVVGVTDMTPTSTIDDIAILKKTIAPHIRIDAYGRENSGLNSVKVIVSDYLYPDPDLLAKRLNDPKVERIAVHASSFEALALIVASEKKLGSRVRIEHAFLSSDDLLNKLVEHGVQIGVHPGFIFSHGERLSRELSHDELKGYMRLASMRRGGLHMFGGTDSPFSKADIWQCMSSAVQRQTELGKKFDEGEALTPEEAFSLFTPGGLVGEANQPQIYEGKPADICVIDRPWVEARSQLSKVRQVMTINKGKVTYSQ